MGFIGYVHEKEWKNGSGSAKRASMFVEIFGKKKINKINNILERISCLSLEQEPNVFDKPNWRHKDTRNLHCVLIRGTIA